jgi:hypothetical protein
MAANCWWLLPIGLGLACRALAIRGILALALTLGSLGSGWGGGQPLPASIPPCLWSYCLGTAYQLGPGDQWSYRFEGGQRYKQIFLPGGLIRLGGKDWKLGINLMVTLRSHTIVMVWGTIRLTPSPAESFDEAYAQMVARVQAEGWTEERLRDVARAAAKIAPYREAQQSREAIVAEWKAQYGEEHITYLADRVTDTFIPCWSFMTPGL